MEAPQESARIGLLGAIQVNVLNTRLANPSDVLCQTYGISGDPASLSALCGPSRADSFFPGIAVAITLALQILRYMNEF
jgi:hypothetical protein